jgi:uncharacterized protein YigE (DUF2233 family)
MGRRWICVANIIIAIVFASTAAHAASSPWSMTEAGIEYRKVTVAPASGESSGTLHFFRIDPKRWKLRLITARQFHRDTATVKFLAQEGRARLAINGGFFSADFKPLGLRISDSIQSNPLRSVSWWGVFAIVLGKPQLFSMKDYAPAKPPEFAIQAGPRLLVNSSIVSTLKEGLDQRSGIGMTAEGLIVIAVTERAWISLTEFAQWMRSSEGGGCVNALNLDGGHSSQLYYANRISEIAVDNTSTIVDAIGVFAK